MIKFYIQNIYETILTFIAFKILMIFCDILLLNSYIYFYFNIHI